jgi:hypothetical protein
VLVETGRTIADSPKMKPNDYARMLWNNVSQGLIAYTGTIEYAEGEPVERSER